MKTIYSLLLAAFLLATVSCQQDEIFTEQEDNNLALKSYTLVDDYRWELTIPSNLGDFSKGLLTLPENWNDLPNRYLIFYAHGMVDPDFPIALPEDLVGGKPVEQIVKDMGMGYATTSYGDNGLVAYEAVDDIKQLANGIKNANEDEIYLTDGVVTKFFKNNRQYLPPDYVFLGGPSEGGLVTVLTIERYPDMFDGALSICGPIGNFYNQLQYNGDFHVLFNYFFEEELDDKYHKYVGNPKDGVGGQDSTMGDWNDGEFQLIITELMKEHPKKVIQLLRCAKVKVDMNDPVAIGTAVLECLRFNVKLTNDVVSRLGGVPFNNTRKWYWGSYNDWRLNRYVQRILTPDYPVAKSNVKKFETTGEIEIPLVTLHTTGDHITPYWHQTAYRTKIFLNGNSLLYTGIPVFNYGHCTIEESHLMAAMAILITKVRFKNLFAVDQSLFSNEQSLESFKQILKENSVEVQVN